MAELDGYQPNAEAPVTGSNGPTDDAQTKRDALNVRKLTPEEINDWFNRIKMSQERRKRREDKWEILLKAYIPVIEGGAEEVREPLHFRNIHTKIGQLFVRSPEVRLIPKGPATDPVQIMDPMTGMPRIVTPEEVVPIRAAVINSHMGRGAGKINGTRLMDECLFDIMGWTGQAWVKAGYMSVQKTYNEPVMQPDPNFVPPPVQPGSMLSLAPQPQPPMVPVIGPDGNPMTKPVPVTVWERWYAERFSPKKGLLDEQLTSTRYQEQSRWIGMEAFLIKKQCMRDFGLNEDQLGSGVVDDRVYDHEGDTQTKDKKSDLVHVYELYFRPYHFYEWESNPDAIWQLTLIDGQKDLTAVCRPHPDQTFDEQGILTEDSIRTFPIKVGCTRDLADSPFPPADSAFVNNSVKEINTYAKQDILIRDAAIGKYLYDTDIFDNEDKDILKNAKVGEYIGVKPGALEKGVEAVISVTPQVKLTQDSYMGRSQLKQSVDEALGIGPNQAGVETDTVRSATETATSQANSAGRQEKEQSRVVEFYLEIVEHIDTLIVRYADATDYVSIVGEDGTRKLAMWNKKIIAGRYSFDIEPDSGHAIDAARSRQQDLAFYNLIIQDPMVNRMVVLRRVAAKFGYDPTKIIATPEQQMAQPQAGGPANKHQMENSGQNPGGKKSGTAGDNRQERNPR